MLTGRETSILSHIPTAQYKKPLPLSSGKRHKNNRSTLFFMSLKLVLGCLILSFFLNYAPSLGYPQVQNLSKVYADDAQTQTVVASDLPDSFQLPHPGYMSTPFSNFHPGIDIATGLGMPIHPIGKGTVIEAGFNFWGLGLMVIVDHGQGYKSLYAHMGKIYVSKDQKVDKSDILGAVGLTGHTTGPHTHLEITKNDTRLDPQTILPTIRNYPQPSDFEGADQGANITPITASAAANLIEKGQIASASAFISETPAPTLIPTFSPSASPSPTPIATPEKTDDQIPSLTVPEILNTPKKAASLSVVSEFSSQSSSSNKNEDQSRYDLETLISSNVNLTKPTSYESQKEYRLLDIKSILFHKDMKPSNDLVAILPHHQP